MVSLVCHWGSRWPHTQLRGVLLTTAYSCRVWYMDGNYLVILVSVTIILPLALMRQLGESPGSGYRGTLRDTGEARVSRSPPLQATWVTPVASLSAAWCSS